MVIFHTWIKYVKIVANVFFLNYTIAPNANV